MALVATVLATFLAACEDSKPKRSSSDDDEEESRPRKAKTSASVSSSAEASGSSSAGATAEGPAGSASVGVAPSSAPKDALTLDDGKHRVAVSVDPDGQTRLVAYDAKGTIVDPEKVSGTVGAAGGEPEKIEVKDDAIVAKLPELEKGLTTIELKLKIAGEKFEHTLDVPEGGTAALAKPPKKTIPPGTKGPNGGTVEVVGDHIVEIVIDEKTDDLRVYFLNEKLEQIEVPEGTEIELNIEDEGKP